MLADKVFGPHTNSQEVYDVAAKPVVKAAMEGVNGIWILFLSKLTVGQFVICGVPMKVNLNGDYVINLI